MTQKSNIKALLKGLLIVCSFTLVTNILAIPFIFLYQSKIINYEIFTILLYIAVTIFYIALFYKKLKKDIKPFKKDYKNILKITFNYWLKGIFIMIISSVIINLIGIPANTNQEANTELLKQMPIIEFICAVLLAPIYEELIFRGALKECIKNKHIYAYLTGIIFGLIHVTSSITSLSELYMLVYLIPFSSVGIAFAYAYKKTDNIYGTIIIHAIHNLISLIEIIILGGII